MTAAPQAPGAADAAATAGSPDTAGQPYTRDGSGPDPENPPTIIGDDAQNVVMVQTSGSTWDVRVSGTDDVVGTITKTDELYTATDARGADLGGFDSPELAMFGVIAHS